MNSDNFVDFFSDPLRLMLIVIGVVVLLGIFIFGRRSSKQRELLYHGSSRKDYSFNSMSEERLVDEEVIVLPRRKTESELFAESHFSANYDDQAAADFDSFKASSSKGFVSSDDLLQETGSLAHQKQEIKEPASNSAEEVARVEKAQTLKRAEKLEQSVVQQSDNQAQNTEAQAQPRTQQQPSPPQQVQQKFVVLYVVAAKECVFTGKSIFGATQTLGMALGKHNVFHYPADSAYVGDSAFCMTNMTAEGNFDIENLDEIQTKGVSLILTLPTMYSDGLTVFSNMLAVAQALSKKLGGDIIDQSGMPLTADLVTSMRLDIEKFERQTQQPSLVPEI